MMRGDTSLYLSGVYAPVLEELTEFHLKVIGTIPRDLNGLFVHNGPNPRFEPNVGHSWFDGDGMVHGVQVDDGRAIYRSRWIHTAGLEADLSAGRATHVGSQAAPGAGKRHKNVANTDLVYHCGRLLALWWEGGMPHQLSLPDLRTTGIFDYGGTLTGGLTSHAKVDPKTGELFFISWGRKPPYLHVGTAGRDGLISHFLPVGLPGPRIQHDMCISDRFICVFDFPLVLDPEQRNDGRLGFLFNPDQSARIGLIERRNQAAAPRWFSVSPCFMWHLSSAWDDNDEFILLGARIEHPTRVDSLGRVRESGPIVDGEHRFDARPYMWRLNVKTGATLEGPLDDTVVEFPRVNDAYLCSRTRYSYMIELARNEPTVKGIALLKYDLTSRVPQRLRFPPREIGYEVSFAQRDGGTEEDDGYLVGFVTNQASLTSEFWITPATALADGPIARVQLPQRVPPKFHGRWISNNQLATADRRDY